MARELSGKSIVITGASSGIGATTALACANAGMNCILNARREDKLREVAKTVEATGRRVQVLVGDASDERCMTEMLDLADRDFVGVYAVLANAGYGESMEMHKMS
ncbi:MAG: SDR family NAD(P)-dependent oxidoreductase, partial [Phycisphaerae bacterium]